MKIVQAELIEIEIPMQVEVEHALASRSVARNILLKLTDADGLSGWGECCPRHYVTGETFEGAWENLKTNLIPQLNQFWSSTAEQVVEWLETTTLAMPRNQNAAFCALELALLDLLGKQQNVDAAALVANPTGDSFRYSGVIATSSLEKVTAMAMQIKQFGIAQTKLKLHEDLTLNQALTGAVRQVLGKDHDLRGDANCAWKDADEATRQLTALSEFGLSGIEQPLEADDIAGLSELSAKKLCSVVVDESLCSLEDAKKLIDHRACDIFNLRISKCGGLINCHRIYQLAIQHGIRCQIGAQVGETSCLSAAGLSLSALAPEIIWREGCFGTMLLKEDPFIPVLTLGPGGAVNRPEGAGLGIEIDEDVLARYSTTQWNCQLGA